MTSKQMSFKGFLGLGHESTYGTAVSRTAFARFLDAEITRKHGEESNQTSRLSGAEDVSLGDYDPRFSFRTEARPENISAMLCIRS